MRHQASRPRASLQCIIIYTDLHVSSMRRHGVGCTIHADDETAHSDSFVNNANSIA